MFKLDTNKARKPNDFTQGDKVTYIPYSANNDPKHEDCEEGIVSSINDTYVFVRYYNSRGILKEGTESTRPMYLRHGHLKTGGQSGKLIL